MLAKLNDEEYMAKVKEHEDLMQAEMQEDDDRNFSSLKNVEFFGLKFLTIQRWMMGKSCQCSQKKSNWSTSKKRTACRL